ncbi:hypothetical protein RQ734_11640 [Roseomonas mucosa]|uniref:hypothetical protein n=1 Tax=Roseomonas mucosa TaxID=207340 RepID=UPI0028CC8E61|nr:hypothetical protein [Roseomonas mucosa]MDT8276717.1 hypothetical protein [Roseomonas mucosa]MDT8356800.1 hypothetical protein [Roseomonas mucosa]
MSEQAPDRPRRSSEQMIVDLIAAGGTVTQHGGGVRAVSIEGVGMISVTEATWFRALPWWPRPGGKQA